MRRKKETDYDFALEELKKKKELYDKRQELYQLKRSMRRWKPPTATKIIVAYIFTNCTVIEVFAMYIIRVFADSSSLCALVTAVLTESLSFIAYAAKAYNETKQEEIIKLERDKMNAALETGDTDASDTDGTDGDAAG